VVESVLERGLADGVLTTGVVANVFLLADGVELGDASREFIEEKGYADEIERAERLLAGYGDRIHRPSDVAVERDGERVELSLDDLPPREGEAAMDVGEATIADYVDRMADAETVILNGPAGVCEDERFRRGTRGIFEAATRVTTSIVGGGDTAAALRTLGIEGFSHVSTGGGAALTLLTGDELPAAALLADGD
jgi:phosphoglycerate kinase